MTDTSKSVETVSEDATKGDNKTFYTGTVKWFNLKRGFGFVTPSTGQTMPDNFVGSKTDEDSDEIGDVFLHYSEIQCSGYKFVNSGQTCKFTLYKDSRGKDAAGNVTNLDGTQFTNMVKRKRKKKKKKNLDSATSESTIAISGDDVVKPLSTDPDSNVDEADKEAALPKTKPKPTTAKPSMNQKDKEIEEQTKKHKD